MILIATLAASTTHGSWWVNTPSGFQRAFGGPARLGPYPTRAHAIAVWNANFSGPPNISGYDDPVTPPPPPPPSQAEIERLAREAEEQRKQQEFTVNQANAAALIKTPAVPMTKPAGASTTLRDDRSRVLGDPGGVGDTHIKDVRPEREQRDLAGRQAAWKQVNGAAYLANRAIGSGNADEACYLAEQAFRAANGDPLGVALPPPPKMPGWSPEKITTPEYRSTSAALKERLKQQLTALVAHEKEQKTRIVALHRAETDWQAASDKLEQLSAASTTGPTRAQVEAELVAAEAAKIASQQAIEQGQAEEARLNTQINRTVHNAHELERDPGLARKIENEIETDETDGTPSIPAAVPQK